MYAATLYQNNLLEEKRRHYIKKKKFKNTIPAVACSTLYQINLIEEHISWKPQHYLIDKMEKQRAHHWLIA